jgi:ribosomal protein S12 methylthiotransferase accessory factor
MSGILAPPAACVPDLLRRYDQRRPAGCDESGTAALIKELLARRRQFGITRVGSITRLDRIGIPVVQVTRPLSLSNAVTQGKGLDLAQAAASALMETLETWAGEHVRGERYPARTTTDQGDAIRALYEGCLVDDAPDAWGEIVLSWLRGWELFQAAETPVPAALVDTIYTLPSPHPFVFPRTTTGLAAARTLVGAIVHAGLEILERDAVAQAQRMPHFFDRYQIDPDSIRDGRSEQLVRRLRRADLAVGIWRVPARHALPIYWCHVLEQNGSNELAPLPAEGFGCAFTHDEALAKALLEACQARLTAIAGAREDITRRHYPRDYDRKHLADWQHELAHPVRTMAFPCGPSDGPAGLPALDELLAALRAAGANACLIVPLFIDEEAGIHVIRMIVPPLRHGRYH